MVKIINDNDWLVNKRIELFLEKVLALVLFAANIFFLKHFALTLIVYKDI